MIIVFIKQIHKNECEKRNETWESLAWWHS